MTTKCKYCGYKHTKKFFSKCCQADILAVDGYIDKCTKCLKNLKDEEIIECVYFQTKPLEIKHSGKYPEVQWKN